MDAQHQSGITKTWEKKKKRPSRLLKTMPWASSITGDLLPSQRNVTMGS